MFRGKFQINLIGGNVVKYSPNFDENCYDVTRISSYNEVTTSKESSEQVLDTLLRAFDDGYFKGITTSKV